MGDPGVDPPVPVFSFGAPDDNSAHLPSAPTFYPTAKQFRNPLAYLELIRPTAQKYGICQIVPPKTKWDPPFCINKNKLKFPARKQKINELLIRKTQRLRFLDKLTHFWDEKNKPLKTLPNLQGRQIDLHLLHTVVNRMGGFDKVTAEKNWHAVVHSMNLHHAQKDRAIPALKKHYSTILLPFERAQRGAESDKASEGFSRGGKDLSLENELRDASGNATAGGGLLSRRANNSEVVQLNASQIEGRETSNAGMYEEEVIVYNPPKPGMELCEICQSGGDYASMLLCDRCNCGFHLGCLTPPLKTVPPGEWFCPTCLSERFGFDSTRVFKFHQFERQANAFKHAFFAPLIDDNRVSKKVRLEGVARDAEARALASGRRLEDIVVDPREVEWQFWNIVTTPDQPVEVLYGSDLDTMDYGSGFPKQRQAEVGVGDASTRVDRGVAQYCNAPWNLNNLCKLKNCVLSHCGGEISGMMVPWLYVGMVFASFCWHVEDHFAHSINYMHCGSPKTWYGIPGHAAEKFEQVMRDEMPELMQSEQGLLFKMVTMLPPETIAKAGVPIFHLLQRPGSFVVTWPRAYHAGFSHGLNIAESSNFATPDWLPWGRASIDAYRDSPSSRKPCFVHEKLLLSLAESCNQLSPLIAEWVAPELERLIIDEETAVQKLIASCGEMDVEICDSADEKALLTIRMCKVCEYECFLSSVEVSTCDESIDYCLHHALQQKCQIQGGGVRLVRHRSQKSLNLLLKTVRERAAEGKKWLVEADRFWVGEAPRSIGTAHELVTHGIQMGIEDEMLRSLQEWHASAIDLMNRSRTLLSLMCRSRRGTLPSLADAATLVRAAKHLKPEMLSDDLSSLTAHVLEAEELELELRAELSAALPSLERLTQLGNAASSLPFALSCADQLERVVCGLRLAHRANDFISKMENSCKLSREDVSSLLSEANKMDTNSNELDWIRNIDQEANSWSRSYDAALRRGASLPEIDLLIKSDVVQRINFESKVGKLIGIADSARSWLREAEAIRANINLEGPSKYGLSTVQELIRRAAKPRTAPLMRVLEVDSSVNELRDALNKSQNWLGRAMELFLKPNSQLELLTILNAAIETQYPWPPEELTDACPCCSVSPSPQCHGSTNLEVSWIGCDMCDTWFHSECVGLTGDAANALQTPFTCPHCVMQGSRSWPHGPAWRLGKHPPLKYTKRPTYEQVTALMAEVDSMWLRPAEVNCIGKLVERTARWRVSVLQLVEKLTMGDMVELNEIRSMALSGELLEVVPPEMKLLLSRVEENC